MREFCYSLIIQRKQRIFQAIAKMLVFDNKSTEAIKVNYLKTLICDGLVGTGKIDMLLILHENSPTPWNFMKNIKLRKLHQGNQVWYEHWLFENEILLSQMKRFSRSLCWCTTYSCYSKWIKFQQASIGNGYWPSD